MVLALLQSCRIITLDTQITKKTKGYCMAWLADYSMISPKYLKQLFDKDSNHLRNIYQKVQESMEEQERQEFLENLIIVTGNKKLQDAQSLDSMSFAKSQSPSFQEHTIFNKTF